MANRRISMANLDENPPINIPTTRYHPLNVLEPIYVFQWMHTVAIHEIEQLAKMHRASIRNQIFLCNEALLHLLQNCRP